MCVGCAKTFVSIETLVVAPHGNVSHFSSFVGRPRSVHSKSWREGLQVGQLVAVNVMSEVFLLDQGVAANCFKPLSVDAVCLCLSVCPVTRNLTAGL